MLKWKIEREKSLIIMLQETKCSEAELKEIKARIWCGCEVIATDATRTIRGMGILWNPREVGLNDLRSSRFIFSANFHIVGMRVRGGHLECLWITLSFIKTKIPGFISKNGRIDRGGALGDGRGLQSDKKLG